MGNFRDFMNEAKTKFTLIDVDGTYMILVGDSIAHEYAGTNSGDANSSELTFRKEYDMAQYLKKHAKEIIVSGYKLKKGTKYTVIGSADESGKVSFFNYPEREEKTA